MRHLTASWARLASQMPEVQARPGTIKLLEEARLGVKWLQEAWDKWQTDPSPAGEREYQRRLKRVTDAVEVIENFKIVPKYAPASTWAGLWSHMTSSPKGPEYQIKTRGTGGAFYGEGLYALRKSPGDPGFSIDFTLAPGSRVYAWDAGHNDEDDDEWVAKTMGLLHGWDRRVTETDAMDLIRKHYDAMVLGVRGNNLTGSGPAPWIVVYNADVIERVL